MKLTEVARSLYRVKHQPILPDVLIVIMFGWRRFQRHADVAIWQEPAKNVQPALKMCSRLYGRFTDHKTGRDILSFLRWVRSRYPRWQKLHIVMDNYGPHITDQVRAWAKDHNIRFYLTPTNGSWLNRIESQFTALRKFALQPSDYRSHEEQEAAIESYLTWRNGSRDLSITAWTQFKHENAQAA